MKEFIKKNVKIIFDKSKDKVFLLCLLFASFLWLLNKLNNTYTYTITVPMVITGAISDFDKDIIAKDDKIYYIDTKFTGRGLNLLQIELRGKIVISPSDLIIEKVQGDKQLYHVNLESLRAAFAAKFSSVDVSSIINKRVVLQTKFFSEKKVPLYSNITIESAGEYMVVDEMALEPDSVMVYGTKVVVDTITRIYTESVHIDKADRYVSGEVKIAWSDNFVVTPRVAQYAISMERYTEVKKTLRVVASSISDDFKYLIFPNEVEVSFNVAQNVFSQFHPDSVVFYVNIRSKKSFDGSSNYFGEDKYFIHHSPLPDGVEIRSIYPLAVSVYENKTN